MTLYLSTHLGSMVTTSLKPYNKGDSKAQVATECINNRALSRRLQTLHQNRDRHDNLGGLSVMKIWGLASIINDGLIVTCVSVHPGDMPEYITPSLESSTLVFASDTSDDQGSTFPWLDVPAVWDVSTVQETIINATLDYSSVEVNASGGFSERIRTAVHAAKNLLVPQYDSRFVQIVDERCAICEEAIPFDSLTEATCNDGHQCSKYKPPFQIHINLSLATNDS